MKNINKFIVFFFAILFSPSVWANLPVGEKPPQVIIQKDSGGKIDGSPWNSGELSTNKIHVLFYVDPDEWKKNTHVDEALKTADFPPDKFGRVVILNMAATWVPSAMINMKMQSKQKENPDWVYVKDNDKVLVRKWRINDDDSNIVLFGKDGRVLYSVDGKYSEQQVQDLLNSIKEHL